MLGIPSLVNRVAKVWVKRVGIERAARDDERLTARGTSRTTLQQDPKECPIAHAIGDRYILGV